MALRISAQRGLLSGKFRHEGLDLSDAAWTEVDANDPKLRKQLLVYVPSHVRLAPRQEAELAEAGLELRDNRLIDLRTAKAAPEAAPVEKKKEQPKPAPRAAT